MDTVPDKEWHIQTEAEIGVTFPQDKDGHRLSINTIKTKQGSKCGANVHLGFRRH